MKKIKCTIYFEDHGQDFLEWEVEWNEDGQGVVVDCKPLQAWVWCDTIIKQRVDELVPGTRVKVFFEKTGKTETIEYPIKRIFRI